MSADAADTPRRSPAALVDALAPGLGDVDPEGHAKALEAEAPGFAALLRGSAVLAEAALFRRADADAARARRAFKRAAFSANLSIAATAIAAAALLAVAALPRAPEESGWPVALLGALGAAGGAVGATLLGLVRQGGWLGRWMRNRAEAEAQRVRFFEATGAGAAALAPAEAPLLLEHFRRFQLDSQIAYHGGRARDHGRRARAVLALGALSVFLAAMASALGGVLAAGDRGMAWVAALGVVGTALGAFAASAASVGQYEGNRELHEEGWRALTRLRARLDAVRAAVAAGDASAIGPFVAAVHGAMRAEHERWRRSESRTAAAVEELDAALARSGDRWRAAPAGAGLQVVRDDAAIGGRPAAE